MAANLYSARCIDCLAPQLRRSARLKSRAASSSIPACREHYSPVVNRFLWLGAELAIVACDLAEVLGSALAASLFAIALLASGQSSTFTGTIAGQVIMDGFMDLKIPCWQRRLLTRGLALGPAFLGVWLLGDGAIGKMLALSQVVLSFQLPFAIWPLIRFTSSVKLMGSFAIRPVLKSVAWGLFGVISAANVRLVVATVWSYLIS